MFIVNLAQGTISVETFGYICELWGYFWLVGTRTRLINFELFYPVFQNPATGSQKQGRFGLIEPVRCNAFTINSRSNSSTASLRGRVPLKTPSLRVAVWSTERIPTGRSRSMMIS